MRKILLAATIALLVFPAGADAQELKKGRKETRQYITGSGLRGAYEGTCDVEPVGCVIFTLGKKDRFVSLDIVDTAGMPVWASVYIYGYTDGHDVHEHVCGSTDGALKIPKGLDLLVVTVTQTTAGATSPCVGPATVGEVTATFTPKP